MIGHYYVHRVHISSHANALLQTMHPTENVDFPFTFLLILGKKLSLRDRERSRRVSTRWNAAYWNMPPCMEIPIKSVTVQDEMIAFEMSKISRRFHFRNGKLCLCLHTKIVPSAPVASASLATSAAEVLRSALIWDCCFERKRWVSGIVLFSNLQECF